MASPQDVAVEWAPESVAYGTVGTVWRALEFLSAPLKFDKKVVQGKGLRVGRRVAASARRQVVTVGGSLTHEYEATTRGTGLLWATMMGASTSTLVSAGLYQQVFTFGASPTPLSVKQSIPQVTATTWGVFSAVGGMCKSFEIDQPNADLVKIKSDWDFQTITGTTAGSLSPTYPTAGNLLAFDDASISTGALTAPTATALASMPTPISIRALNIKVDNSLNVGRFNTGTGGGKKSKPVPGEPKITGKFTIEYDATTYTDLILNDGAVSLLGSWTNGTDVLQVVLPEIKINGDLPAPNAGELITHDCSFEGLDNLTAAQPLWIVQRTADVAI